VLPSFAHSLKSGQDNELELYLEGASEMPYSISVTYFTVRRIARHAHTHTHTHTHTHAHTRINSHCSWSLSLSQTTIPTAVCV
jgi:hypothetical protein